MIYYTNMELFFAFLLCASLASLASLLPRAFPNALWMKYLPPPLWCYTAPMVLRGSGLTPAPPASLQELTGLILPTALFLVLLQTPLMALKLAGPRAIAAMGIGSLGIVAGGISVFLLFRGRLPPDAWQSLSLLSATWTGGSLNMLAVREALQFPEPLLGPLILVDSFIAYSWLAFLLSLVPYQTTLDRWLRAGPLLLQESSLPSPPTDRKRGFGRWTLFAVTLLQMILCLAASRLLPPFSIFSQKTWGILLATLFALLLSQHPIARSEEEREAQWGQFSLYLVLAGLGLQGEIRAFAETPLLLLVGIIWVGIHGGVLLLAGRSLRLPFGLLATASQANVGGVISAPLVGASYHPGLIPVGLLLSILGNLIGTPLGLFCAYLMRLIG